MRVKISERPLAPLALTLAIGFSVVGVLHPPKAVATDDFSSPVAAMEYIDRLSQNLLITQNEGANDTYAVSLSAGVLRLPKEFVLRSTQQQGRLFSFEPEELTNGYLLGAYLLITNEDEIDMSIALDQSVLLAADPILKELQAQCQFNAERRKAEYTAGNPNLVIKQEFLKLDGQTLTFSPILSPVIDSIMRVFISNNCDSTQSE
ncbi:MAG: hypothetical protein AAGF10_05900 [Verrucomicrobiota bacterium]